MTIEIPETVKQSIPASLLCCLENFFNRPSLTTYNELLETIDTDGSIKSAKRGWARYWLYQEVVVTVNKRPLWHIPMSWDSHGADFVKTAGSYGQQRITLSWEAIAAGLQVASPLSFQRLAKWMQDCDHPAYG